MHCKALKCPNRNDSRKVLFVQPLVILYSLAETRVPYERENGATSVHCNGSVFSKQWLSMEPQKFPEVSTNFLPLSVIAIERMVGTLVQGKMLT